MAEAQIRLFRRERSPVLSQVWDLYGDPAKPVLAERTLPYGAPYVSARSQCIYHRVNLRGLRWQELLSHGATALWPLVTLTRDGASEEVVRRAHDSIEGRAELGSGERADYLAVLWFVAEAEGVPTQLMRAYMSEERLMESTLYRSIFEKGEAQGEARGRAQGEAQGKAQGEAQGEAQSKKETILRILVHRLGSLEPTVRERIRALSEVETLTGWYEEALLAVDAEAARRLVEKIQKAPLA